MVKTHKIHKIYQGRKYLYNQLYSNVSVSFFYYHILLYIFFLILIIKCTNVHFRKVLCQKYSRLSVIKELVFQFLRTEQAPSQGLFIQPKLEEDWFKHWISINSIVSLNWIITWFPPFTRFIPITMLSHPLSIHRMASHLSVCANM